METPRVGKPAASAVAVRTYRDAFLNTRKLVDEAERLHAIKASKDAVAEVAALKRYAPHNKTRLKDVIEMIGTQYQNRLLMHVQNTGLKPEGIFTKGMLQGLIENSMIRNWGTKSSLRRSSICLRKKKRKKIRKETSCLLVSGD